MRQIVDVDAEADALSALAGGGLVHHLIQLAADLATTSDGATCVAIARRWAETVASSHGIEAPDVMAVTVAAAVKGLVPTEATGTSPGGDTHD